MSIVKGHRIQTDNVSFSDVKTNDNGGKTIYMNYNKGMFKVQTPVMTLPYDMSCYDKGEYPKYTVEVSFRDMDENDKVKLFHEVLESLDELLVDSGVKNSMAWFKKKKTNKDVISALFNPMVKKSKDKETGEYDGKYPDTLRLKLPFRDGKPGFEMFNLDSGDKIEDKEPSELFVKGARVQAILRCGGIWIVGGKFGCTWTVEKIRVDAPEGSSKGYSFIDDDSDDEDAGDAGDSKSKSSKSTNSTSNKVDDSDDDDSDEDEDDSDEDSE